MAVRTFGIAGKTDSAEDYRITASGLLVPASALNLRTGVLSTPVLTSTGSLTCTVSPCTVAIDGTSNSLQAGYLVTNDLTATVTFATGSAAARTDLICLQVLDNAYDGSGQNKGQITYVQGVSGGGVPATPANSIVLWQVPVGAGASSVNFASAVAVFPYTAANGGIVPVRNAGDKPAVVNAVQYRHRLDITAAAGSTSPLEASIDGVTWYPVYDASVVPAAINSAINTAATAGPWTNLTMASGWNSPAQAQYRSLPGGKVELRGKIDNSATVSTSGAAAFTGCPTPALTRYLPFNVLAGSGAGHFEVDTPNTCTAYPTATLSIGTYFSLDGLSYST